MNDLGYYNKAIGRYLAVTHDKCDRKTNEFYENVIVFLEKEMEQQMQDASERIAKQKALLNTIYGACGKSIDQILMDREFPAPPNSTKQPEEFKKEIEQRIKIIDEFSLSIGKDVQELSNKQDALCDRVEQLGQMVENKMDQVLGDAVQTLTEFTTEQIGDGGVMTLATHTNTKAVQEVLLQNGYFVCSHIDDEPNEQDEETIAIEFWRA